MNRNSPRKTREPRTRIGTLTMAPGVSNSRTFEAGFPGAINRNEQNDE
jgi:hypothetical protein